MIRFLGNCLVLIYLACTLLLLLSQGIGRTAPPISKIAFFKDRIDNSGTDYWRLDLFTGVSFVDSYQARIFIPEINQAPLEHFFAVTSDTNYYTISEVNLYSRELSYVSFYPTRGYSMFLAGDYIFTYDLASEWRRVDISTGNVDYFGGRLTMMNIRTSPDGQWIAGRIYNQNWLFVNAIDGSSYEIEPYSYLIWSPDSSRYLVGNYQTAAILNAADGSVLLEEFPARLATWSSDSESLVIENQGQLALLNVETSETNRYSADYSFFWLQCLSPDKHYILSHDDAQIYLLDLESSTGQALSPLANSTTIQCFWSADNHYLLFLVNSASDSLFYFLDMEANSAWKLYPDNLPPQPVYLHIPD